MEDRQAPTINLFKHEKDNVAFYDEGEVLMRPGDPGDCMYVVQEGLFHVLNADGDVIDMVGPGGILGEMALIDNSPRSAMVVAATDSRVVPLTQEQFMGHVHRTPFFAIQVLRIVTERLRHQIQNPPRHHENPAPGTSTG